MDQYEKSQQQYTAEGADQMGNTPPPLPDTPDVVASSSNVCVPVSSTMQSPTLPGSTAQQQYINTDGASQMANEPAPIHDTPGDVATSSNICVPVSSTMQLPPLPVSTTQHRFTLFPEGEAHNSAHVRERLKLFWDNQMQEMKPADIKNNSLPLSRVKKIMKAENCNEDVRMVAKESTALLAKACEMLVLDMTSRAWINTEEDRRRTLKKKDIAAAIHKTDNFDFLEVVIGPETQSQQNQLQQPFMPWHQAQSQQNENLLFMTWHQAQPQQHLSMPWSQVQDQHIMEQPNMSWTQAELTPDQQIPQPPSPSLPQAEHQHGQKRNDEN